MKRIAVCRNLLADFSVTDRRVETCLDLKTFAGQGDLISGWVLSQE